MNLRWSYVLLVATCISTVALGDDRAAYNRQSAERFVAMFRQADVNKDNVVSTGEAQGIIELQAHFNDIDINRDSVITSEELARYVDAKFH